MTTDIKVRTNGAYVAEVVNGDGDTLGKVGPAKGVTLESDWINVAHESEVTVVEREATEEELAEFAEAHAEGPEDSNAG